MGKTNARGLTRLINATRYSAKGIKAAWQNEEAFRQEALLAIVAFPLAIFISQSVLQFAALGATILLILIVELLNSAIEAIVDKTSPEHHILAGRAKDMGSAAVLFTLTLAALVWGAMVIDNFIL